MRKTYKTGAGEPDPHEYLRYRNPSDNRYWVRCTAQNEGIKCKYKKRTIIGRGSLILRLLLIKK